MDIDEIMFVPNTERVNTDFRTQSASVVITRVEAATEEHAFFSGETAVEDRADDEAD